MERFNTETVNQFKSAIRSCRGTVVLIPHINADGDATGSVFGLWKVLTNLGIHAKVISPNHYASYYNWMCGHQEALVYTWHKDTAQRIIDRAEIMICLDFNTPSRAGEMQSVIENFNGTRILIDHHPDPSDFADILISDTRRSSTAELVFALLCEAKLNSGIDREAASCLFAGIMTDTGSFNYNVSDPETFRIISELLAYEINQDEIHSAIYDNFSEERTRLMGHCLLNRMKVYPEYHAAMLYLNKDDQKQFNFRKGDSEGFVNMPLSMKGIHFSAFFSENDDHVKVSFRSKGTFPVNRFSEENFNGGGHLNAAGGEIYVSLDEAMDKFEKLLELYKDLLEQTAQ